MNIHILKLTYSINFNDADDGDCYAGDGERIISAHRDNAVPSAIASELNPILKQAENENTVFPIQKFNRLIKSRLGFTLHDINDGYNFLLKVDSIELED